jgi:hypothetical protein
MTNDAAPYHFFIAHANTDKSEAELLYDLLAPNSRVFLDTRCLLLGDDWDKELPKAQKNSLITVVLLSSNSEKAYYQREEIVAAINLARQDEKMHRVSQ